MKAERARPEDRRSVLEDSPPSVKLLHFVLRRDGASTKETLAEQTLLPERTLRYALRRMDEEGLVTVEPADEPSEVRYAAEQIAGLSSDDGGSRRESRAQD